METVLTDHITSILDRYFDKYTVYPLPGGGTTAELYRIFTTGDGNYILKAQRQSLKNEYLNYMWLQNKMPVPQVIFFSNEGELDLLCMTELPGQPLEFYINKMESDVIVCRYANALKLLHSVRPDNKSFVQNLDCRLYQAKLNLKNDLVHASQFQIENQAYKPCELYEKMLSIKPTHFELVFTHGDYCFDNVMFDNKTLSGFIDLGNGGVADKYQDLALAVRSIEESLDSDMINLFYKSYGINQIDRIKLEFYTLLDEFH
jgi:aminoglycoside phosphotransferase